MKFHLVYAKSGGAQSPVRVVEQKTGHEVGWINRYLDREYVRRLSDKSLRLYAYNLLHFVRWWASVHHTGDVAECGDARRTQAGHGGEGWPPHPHAAQAAVEGADRGYGGDGVG